MLLGGSTANHTATTTTDLDVLVILAPHVQGHTVTVELEGNRCWIEVASSNPPSKVQIDVGDRSLRHIWQAFRSAVTVFTAHHHDIFEIPEIRPGELATFEEDPTEQMWGSFSMGTTEVDVLPALRTTTDVILVLLRTCKPNGSNIVKSFSNVGARRIASLPDKGRLMICALKHVVKAVHNLKVPGCLFESVVLEVFEHDGWVGDLGDTELAKISFIGAWRRCWRRILTWKPIYAPNKAPSEAENLLARIDRERLSELGAQLASLDEQSLMELLQRSPTYSQPGATAATSSTSTSYRARPREDDDDNDRPAKRHRAQADADRTPIINRSSSFSLSRWLSDLGLVQYLEAFKSNGFEDHDIEMVSTLTQEDLKEMSITMLVHRKKILAEAAKLKSS